MNTQTVVKTWGALFPVSHVFDMCDFDPKCETLTEAEHEIMLETFMPSLQAHIDSYLNKHEASLIGEEIVQNVTAEPIDWEDFKEYVESWEPDFARLMQILEKADRGEGEEDE